MRNIINNIQSIIISGNERDIRVKINALGSMGIKCAQMLIEFVKVPVLLTYLDNEKYGAMLAITSIIMWTQHFDFGLGAGLRYKLAESIAKEDIIRSKELVSTAYCSLSLIMGVVLLILAPACYFLDWNSILNIDSVEQQELAVIVISLLIVFFGQFVFDLIRVILQANQRVALSDVLKPIASVISLIGVLLLGLFSHNSLLLATLTLNVPYLLVLIIASFICFKRYFQTIIPSIRYARKYLLKDIYSLGAKFFIDSFASLIVFSTASFLLSHYVNPEEVTTYNIARTYFGLVIIFFGLTQNPMIPAITEASVKNDWTWIRKNVNKSWKVLGIFSLALVLMYLFYPIAIDIWTKGKVDVPVSLAIAYSLYAIMNMIATIYTTALIGLGKFSVRMYISVIKIILFLPVAISLTKLWGAAGLVWAIMTVGTLMHIIFGIIQYKLLSSGQAKGIWNK